MYVAQIFGYYDYIEINAFLTGAISIGIISGAYSTEVFRGAIQSIDKGQFEACHVLGLKKYIYFFKVIMILENNDQSFLKKSAEDLINSRPTAINLKWAVDRMINKLSGVNSDKILEIALILNI